MIFQTLLSKVQDNHDLSHIEMEAVMRAIMGGTADSEEVGSFLLALRQKGYTNDEIAGAARIMREFAVRVSVDSDIVVDTCGTGGDKKDTFNISTVSALVVAAAGVTVAKHGNRSVSSQCGSADILEGLGISLDLTPDQMSTCLNDIGISFLFAQKLHPAMKYVAPIRRKLGVETIFNILGPLTNPAFATHQMVGVYDRKYLEPMAHVLRDLGLRRAMVVHGEGGFDEITLTGSTTICEFDGKNIREYDIHPKDFGLLIASESEIKGGDRNRNIEIVSNLLDGQRGPQQDIVVLNAGAILYLAEKVDSIQNGILLAQSLFDSGAVKKKLEEWILWTKNHEFSE